MELLPILFFFGLSAGAIGKIKGGSFFLWFLLGFALPFIGTLVALLYRNERAVPRRRVPRMRERRGHPRPGLQPLRARSGLPRAVKNRWYHRRSVQPDPEGAA